MARQIRIEYEGSTYHVMARGNHNQSIYGDDQDRKLWLEALGEVGRVVASAHGGTAAMGVRTVVHGGSLGSGMIASEGAIDATCQSRLLVCFSDETRVRAHGQEPNATTKALAAGKRAHLRFFWGTGTAGIPAGDPLAEDAAKMAALVRLRVSVHRRVKIPLWRS